MFYYGVLPLSIIGLLFFTAFLYEEGTEKLRVELKFTLVWLLLSIISYIFAVYFYIKCNSIETYPAL